MAYRHMLSFLWFLCMVLFCLIQFDDIRRPIRPFGYKISVFCPIGCRFVAFMLFFYIVWIKICVFFVRSVIWLCQQRSDDFCQLVVFQEETVVSEL